MEEIVHVTCKHTIDMYGGEGVGGIKGFFVIYYCIQCAAAIAYTCCMMGFTNNAERIKNARQKPIDGEKYNNIHLLYLREGVVEKKLLHIQ